MQVESKTKTKVKQNQD